MQMLPILFPALISCALQQKLEKKEWTVGKLIPVWGVYTVLINFMNLLLYQYVFKNDTGWMDRFANNDFIIRYLLLAIIFAIIFPVLKFALNPFFSIKIEKKKQKENKVD